MSDNTEAAEAAEETPAVEVTAEEATEAEPVAEAAADEPVAEAAADGVAEEPAAEEPVAEAAADEPVAEAADAVAEEPAGDVAEAAAEEGPAEEPVAETVTDEPVAEEVVLSDAPVPAEVAQGLPVVSRASVLLCERGHRTTALWQRPETCNARVNRYGPVCGRPLYPIGELPEQVQKALNPLKASKKSSKKK